MIHKYYGIHRAVVVDVNDPKKLDRVRAYVPEILGNTITDWIWPKHPCPQWSWKPTKDAPIWVEFESGDVDRPLYSGTWYPQVEGESTVPQESQDEYPFHRMIKTPIGHKIEFKDISTQTNDQTGEEEPIEDSPQYMRIITAGGATGEHKIELHDTKDQEIILIQSGGGNTVRLTDISGDESVEVSTPAGHMLVMSDANTELTIEHSDGQTKIELDSSGNVNVKVAASKKITLEGGGVPFPLGGVVTKNHICAFTGSPHPMGSQEVEASG